MPPIRNYSNWNRRPSDAQDQIDPYRRYFFICEGANTETWYFKRLIDLRKELDIHPLIDLCLLEKTEEDRNISYPMQLIDFANKQKKKIGFHKKWDKMIVVFDADIFEKKVTNFQEVVALGEKENILAISNPSFELFLLLHFKDAYEKDILPNMDAIIKNEKVGNHTFIYHLLWKRTGKNSKKNPEIGELATQIGIEIEQERKINQDIHDCQGKITCNIGKIIQMIRGDAANKL